jgi:hypothetical protein
MKLLLVLIGCIALLYCSSACVDADVKRQAGDGGREQTQGAANDSVRAWRGNGGHVAVIFVAPGECTKCDLVTSHAVEWIRDHAPDTKVVALVKCRRPVELAMYLRTNDHIDQAAMHQRGLWTELGGETDSRMLVFDRTGNLCGKITSNEFFGNTDSVLAEIFLRSSRK